MVNRYLFFIVLIITILVSSVAADTIDTSFFSYNLTRYINGSDSSSSSGLINYQIRIILHNEDGQHDGEDVYLGDGYGARANADFGDVRFTDSNGTLLSYWLQEPVSEGAVVAWVNIPYIPFGFKNSTTINIYYGCPFATTTSNGFTTFPFFDDFNDGTLNTSKWSYGGVDSWDGGVYPNQYCTVVEENGYLKAKYNGGGSSDFFRVNGPSFAMYSSLYTRASYSSSGFKFGGGWWNPSYTGYAIDWEVVTGNTLAQGSWHRSNSTHRTAITSGYNNLEIHRINSSWAKFVVNSSSYYQFNYEDDHGCDTLPQGTYAYGCFDSAYGNYFYVDYVFLRNNIISNDMREPSFYDVSNYITLEWDRDYYNVGDNASIAYNIADDYWFPLTYNYTINIRDNTNGVYIESIPIITKNGVATTTLDPLYYLATGLYSAELTLLDTGTFASYRLIYDTMYMYRYVKISGDTWDAFDGILLPSTSVNATQLDIIYNTTSHSIDANYTINDPNIQSNYRIDMNADQTGYLFYPSWFTPFIPKTYYIDLYLLPETMGHNETALGGLVLSSTYHQAIENATVTLSNSTFSTSTTTSPTGWYIFDSTPESGITYETYSTEVVDTTYDMGKYSAITHNGTMLHVAYYDDTNKELIGAYKNGGAWTPSITDNGTITLHDNYVYVADTGNNRIVMRDSNLVYIDKIGSLGSGDDEFNGTTGISAVANYTSLSTYVYIADTNNSRVERRFSNNLTFVDAFGTYGTGDDNFSVPQDICVDGDGLYMWVADTGNHRIVERFAENYTYIAQYGTYGTGTTNFSSPMGISVDPTGTYLLVADTGNSRIMKFFAQNLTYIASVGSIGATDNKFNTPSGIFIERSGSDVFYLADTGNNRIMSRKLSDLTYLRQIGTLGTGADQFNAPRDITSDGAYIYVSDSGNNRIHKRYASDFAYAITIGTSGSGDDQFSNPSGVAVTMNGSVSVDYDVGEYASLTIDDLGNEWVSFYDATNGDLMTAHRHPGSDWHSYRSDSGGDVGQYTSNANYNDMVQVSYYNVTGQNLKYMMGNVSGNYTEIVDWGVGTGKYSSIALTGGGEPRISYYDETNGDLKYAYKSGAVWSNTTIDSLENIGQYTDIAIDSSGYCYISYYDVTNANLKYAYRDGTGWHTQTVDSTGDVGKYTSITRSETTGYVYISYYDATNGNLKMAYYNTTAWNIVTLDSTGDVGKYTSIDLDEDGYPHVLYYDDSNNRLKHTYYYLSGTSVPSLAPSSTYTVTTSKSGYSTNTTSVTTGAYDNLTIFYIYLQGQYRLTVNIRDSDTGLPVLQTATIVLSDGQSANTTTGEYTFTVADGAYSIGVTSSNYRYGYTTVTLDDDTEVTVYIEPYETYTGIDYTIAPRNVRFICVDHFGQRLNGVEVSAVGHDTTLPDWGIFSIIFGWMAAYTNASMTNDTMSGTTGSDGSVVFLMTESLQYSMTFTNSSRSISESLTLYPKDDTYVITLGTSPFAEPDVKYINITLYTSEPNTTATTLWASYNDPNLHTTSANFTVRNASGYVLYSHVTGGSNSFIDSYTVSHVTGTQYTWGIIAVQTDYGNISRYTSTTLHSRLIELGLEDMYYNWISLIFLFILIGLFSGRSVIYGYVVFPLVMGIFYFIGWLQITYVLASGVIILGIMLFLSKRQFQGEGV